MHPVRQTQTWRVRRNKRFVSSCNPVTPTRWMPDVSGSDAPATVHRGPAGYQTPQDSPGKANAQAFRVLIWALSAPVAETHRVGCSWCVTTVWLKTARGASAKTPTNLECSLPGDATVLATQAVRDHDNRKRETRRESPKTFERPLLVESAAFGSRAPLLWCGFAPAWRSS
mmetsp:Transcript_755/g.2119  ORF Transcript_755/g.2119 Transcript_755/m.2119 type:complete len:171 (+) Transcript_755:189-701(+)